MKRINSLILGGLFATTATLTHGQEAQEQGHEHFSQMCSTATVTQAMPGHIIRLGALVTKDADTNFVFPDQNSENLQQVDVAEEVGVIGQDPSADMNPMDTPMGSYVVAQIYVGEENQAPMVTCVSDPIPEQQYDPQVYGGTSSPAIVVLDRAVFIDRLSYRDVYSPWDWRSSWGDFAYIRRSYNDNRRDGGWKFSGRKYRHDRRKNDYDKRDKRDRKRDDGDNRRDNRKGRKVGTTRPDKVTTPDRVTKPVVSIKPVETQKNISPAKKVQVTKDYRAKTKQVVKQPVKNQTVKPAVKQPKKRRAAR